MSVVAAASRQRSNNLENNVAVTVCWALIFDILLDDEEQGRRNRRKLGRTRNWIRGRRIQGYFNNLIKERLVEDI